RKWYVLAGQGTRAAGRRHPAWTARIEYNKQTGDFMKFSGFAPIRPVLFALLTLCLAAPAFADDRGEGPLDPSQPTGITVDQIVQKFAAKEKQFKIAREQYTYTQDVTIQTLEGETVD